MTRVLIVEDQEMTARLFEIIVASSERYEAVRRISNADMALFYCEQENIDLVIMDVCTAMDSSGLEASKRIKDKFPGIKIVIATSMPEFSWIKTAREIGVEGFWYKSASENELIKIMDRVVAGETVYPNSTPEIKLGLASSAEFTYRELEVLRELTTGDSNAEIGDRLGLSPNTVRNTIHNMIEKTGYHSRTELAVEARRLGLVIKGK